MLAVCRCTVNLTVNFNNAQVFSGSVTSETGPIEKAFIGVELASWTIDSSVSGSIPLSIAVTGGACGFVTLHMNLCQFREVFSFDPASPWASNPPAPALTVRFDTEDLDDAAFQTKYGVDKATALGRIIATNENNVDQFFDPNRVTAESDGKNNVLIDGESQPRSPGPGENGKWIYMISNGSTLTCDFVVDPAAVV